VTADGFAYVCPSSLIMGRPPVEEIVLRPTLRLPNVSEVIEKILGQHGLLMFLSDDGHYIKRSIKEAGSLKQLCEMLTDDSVRKVLNLSISDAQREPGLLLGHPNKRRYLTFADVKTILKDSQKARAVIDRLTENGFLERGYVFKCLECRCSEWYRVSEIDDSFVCKRCGERCRYTNMHLHKQHPRRRYEPIWFYRLKEVIYQGYKKNMAATILTLRWLEKQTDGAFDYLCGVKVLRKQSGTELIEVDFFCFLDGQLVMGEAKKGDRLPPVQANRYVEVASLLGANKLVFSTLSSRWTTSAKQNVNSAIERAFGATTQKHEPQLLWLTEKELLG
jgi:hypothetical protein